MSTTKDSRSQIGETANSSQPNVRANPTCAITSTLESNARIGEDNSVRSDIFPYSQMEGVEITHGTGSLPVRKRKWKYHLRIIRCCARGRLYKRQALAARAHKCEMLQELSQRESFFDSICVDDKIVTVDVSLFSDCELPCERTFVPQADTQPSGFVPDTELWKRAADSMAKQALSDYDAYSGVFVNHVENLALFWTSVCDQSTWSGVCSTFMLYVKTHFQSSVLQIALEVMRSYTQVLEPHADGGFMSAMRGMHSNWKLATQCEGFKHISKMLSLLVGAGMLQASSLQCDVAGLKLFSELSVPKFVSAFDLMDAVVNACAFFIEGGYECMMMGSITPLLYGEKDYSKFDDDFMECRRLYQYALPGNLSMLEVDENQVMKKLKDTVEMGKKLVSVSKNPTVKRLVQDRVMKLSDMESTLNQHRLSAGVRMKPFCVSVFGGTGVGKSTMSPLIMYHILQANGYDASDDACIMLKAGQKHEEGYRTHINGVYYDDFANTKAEFQQESPCESLLDTVNTAKCKAKMAALELKDRVSKEPKAVVVSTNVKDLNASQYSEEPAAIVRRCDYILTMRVRPQFAVNGMLSSAKVKAYYNGNVPIFPDCWEIDIQVSYPVQNPTPGRHDTVGFKNVIASGKTMVGVDMKEALRFLVMASKQHFTLQRDMISRCGGLSTKLVVCEGCQSSVDICVCNEQLTIGYEEVATSRAKFRNVKKDPKMCHGERCCFGTRKVEDCPNRPSAAEIEEMKFEEQLRSPRTKFVPHSVVTEVSDYFQYLRSWEWLSVDFLVPNRFRTHYVMLTLLSQVVRHPKLMYGLIPLLFPAIAFDTLFARFVYILCVCYGAYCVFNAYVGMVREHAARQRQAQWATVQNAASRLAFVLGTGFVVHRVYKFISFYRTWKTLTPHGYMHPNLEEIAKIDASTVHEQIAREQNWSTVVPERLPTSYKSKTTTKEQLLHLCEKNTAVIVEDGFIRTNAFFIGSNLALVPTHYLLPRENCVKATFVRQDINIVGGNFEAFVSSRHSIPIPGTDISLLYVPNGGSWKDLRSYFPLTVPTQEIPGRMCTRTITGGIEINKFLAWYEPQSLENGDMPPGYTYNVNSYLGMCCSPIVAELLAPVIMGLHIAGETGKTGFAPVITQDDLETAQQLLVKIESVLVAHSDGTIPPVMFKQPILLTSDIHELSPLKQLEKKDERAPNVRVFGTCSGRASYVTKVRQSKISKAVEEVCGVSQQWSGPKFNKGDPWLESIKYSSRPSIGVEPQLLDRAVVDYVAPFSELLEETPVLLFDIRKLTRMETICGIDGKRFIDKLPANTAVGFPLTGKKEKYITLLDPADFEGFACPAELDSMFWDEFDRAVEGYLQGERYHPIFKACLKDEPTPKNKDKVRVFQAAPTVLQLLVRMYFLPIARLLSLFPALSECAVGLNCMGPEWSEFMAHITKYGKDRILAGDYSKYDLRMPAQLTLAAFRVMINIAEVAGYSKEDIKIMHGIATDICYPTIAFNGDLIQFVGSNPSGQNLTVYINSIVNSLLYRCGFFWYYPGATNFRKACALGTYGDDAESSVKKGFDEFNHVSFAAFLADRDMKFTMPDKTSEPIPYMNAADADFLKRKDTYIPEIDCNIGALDEQSIWKSLHANLKSDALTREQLAATCIDGALRDWFCHGREKYEMRQQQMREVATRCDIEQICKMLDVTFDEQVDAWLKRYRDGDA